MPTLEDRMLGRIGPLMPEQQTDAAVYFATIAELNSQWARRVFSESYGVRSPAGRKLLKELSDARDVPSD